MSIYKVLILQHKQSQNRTIKSITPNRIIMSLVYSGTVLSQTSVVDDIHRVGDRLFKWKVRTL